MGDEAIEAGGSEVEAAQIISPHGRVFCVEFSDRNHFICGTEGGYVTMWLRTGCQVASVLAHQKGALRSIERDAEYAGRERERERERERR
jgi:hypothetical protein